jgi:DNA modification methylase
MPQSKATLYPFNDVFEALDCLSEESVDLIYCDPPWKRSHFRRQETKDRSSINEFHKKMSLNFQRLIGEFSRILNKNGSLYVHLDPTTAHIFRRVADDSDFTFRNEIIWPKYTKAGGGPTFGKFANCHHNILFFTKNSCDSHVFNADREEVMQPRTEKSQRRMRNPKGARNIDPETGKSRYSATYKYRTDVWDDVKSISSGDNRQKNRKTTWKPNRLFEIIIKTSANPEGNFLDVFCGSGTTSLEEAQKAKMEWIGIDPERRVKRHGFKIAVMNIKKSIQGRGLRKSPDSISNLFFHQGKFSAKLLSHRYTDSKRRGHEKSYREDRLLRGSYKRRRQRIGRDEP